jgi:hypothetical protein
MAYTAWQANQARDGKLGSQFGRLAVSLVLWPAQAFVWGYCVAVLWSWFVVPLGLPAIGKAHALGLAVIVRFVSMDVSKVIKDADEETHEFVARQVAVFIVPGFALLFGWVYQQFM